MDDSTQVRLPRRLVGVQARAAREAIERLERQLREAQDRTDGLQEELRGRDEEIAGHREKESQIAGALIEAERAAQRVVAEARREADAIVAAAEDRRDEIAAQADDLWDRCHFFLERLLTDLDRHGDPTTALSRPKHAADPRDPDDQPTSTVTGEPEAREQRPTEEQAPHEEKAPLESPPAGNHVIELECTPVRSAIHVADLERQIVKLDGVKGVRIGRRGKDRVAFLVGVDTPDLDVSPLLSESIRLRAAERDRIVLDLAENGSSV